MNYPRLIFAAPKSGSGKTTVTCGLLAALKNKNIDVCSFKCGPDYIDPMFHRNVIGIESGNLDTFFTDESDTRQIFVNEFVGDMAVIEGVMGLYDGIGGIQLKGSTYDLAKTLKAPIVLVVDARGAGRSILAEIKGFLDYDSNKLIKGVILNKTSESFAKILQPLIEQELKIKCFGHVENNNNIELSSRHLGLVLPDEISDLKEKLLKQANLISAGVDLNGIYDLALGCDWPFEEKKSKVHNSLNRVRIALAKDKAFCFYYRENVELLKGLGAEIVPFSPIEDEKLPEDISGIILGGGYPENYLKELSQNKKMIQALFDKLKTGIPVLAECGGFMYLMDSITDDVGNTYEMVGYIKGQAVWQGKLVRFGYVNLSDDNGLNIKGHEFHYYDTNNNGEDMLATKPTGNRSWKCIHKTGDSIIGFPHLYYWSNKEFAKSFIANAIEYKIHDSLGGQDFTGAE